MLITTEIIFANTHTHNGYSMGKKNSVKDLDPITVNDDDGYCKNLDNHDEEVEMVNLNIPKHIDPIFRCISGTNDDVIDHRNVLVEPNSNQFVYRPKS